MARAHNSIVGDRSPGPSRRPEIARGVALAVAVFLSGAAGHAQSYGRWWWDGVLAAGQRNVENLRDETRLSRYEEGELRLSLGLNGFVLHPEVGDFRVGVELGLSEVDSGNARQTERIGGSFNLNLFPRRSYPFQAFFRQHRFDYSDAETDAPLFLPSAVDTSRSWGSRFRIRRGPLRGTLMGFNHNDFDFVDPTADSETRDSRFVSWGRALGRLQTSVRLGQRERDFGTADLRIEDLTANFDQRGFIAGSWRWRLHGVGIFRDSTSAGATSSVDSYRVRNRLFRTVRGRDQIDLNTRYGENRTDSREASTSWGARFAYRWRPGRGWELAPFIGYAEQSAENLEIVSPDAGIEASWRQSRGSFDSLISARASFGQVEREEAGGRRVEDLTSFQLSASLSHGTRERLRKELEVGVGRNRLDLASEPLIELPDLGLPRRVLDEQDFYRARARLGHSWDSRSISGWAQWNRREASQDSQDREFLSETSSGTVHFGGHGFSVQGRLGETQVEQTGEEDQRIHFASGRVTWRPWRWMDLTATYREDTSQVAFGPDLDGERYQVTLDIQVGLFALRGTAFESRQAFLEGFDRTNRGFYWSVSRQFAGWLPVVTGPRRRGVIR